MSEDTKTPRTNEIRQHIHDASDKFQRPSTFETWRFVVPVSFARTLELEVVDLRAEVERLKGEIVALKDPPY